MTDERVIERYFERAMEGLTDLTNQVRRIANALEVNVRMSLPADAAAALKKCTSCGCQLVKSNTQHCPGCGEFVRTDA
jgi:hypothetical protein